MKVQRECVRSSSTPSEDDPWCQTEMVLIPFLMFLLAEVPFGPMGECLFKKMMVKEAERNSNQNIDHDILCGDNCIDIK